MEKLNMGIVTIPISDAGLMPLSNLVDIIGSFSDKIYLITGDAACAFFKDNQKVKIYGVGSRPKATTFSRILKYIPTQLRITYNLIQVSARTNLCSWIFFTGSMASALPIATAKLLGKNVVSAYAAADTKSIRTQSRILLKPMQLSAKVSLILSNRIVVYSENLIKDWNLVKYRHKISIAPRHFLDFNDFKIHKKLDERHNLVGYIGRFSEEKGTLNFVKTIPQILKKRREVNFLVAGDGRLRDQICKYLNEENLADKVKLPGWLPHNELPKYLNELKLLIIPSVTEGLPNIMLEAMACGTPVLATPVGSMPDVIKDNETGFIMADNSPNSIAENVIRALNHPDLEEIAHNAHILVEKEYTYKTAVERYKSILTGLDHC